MTTSLPVPPTKAFSKYALHYATVFFLGLLPVVTLTLAPVASLIFYLLLTFCCLLWFVSYKKNTHLQEDLLFQHNKILFAAFFFIFLAVSFSKIYHWDFHGSGFELALRFSLGLPLIFMGIRFIPKQLLKYSLLGFYIAIIGACLFILHLIWPNLSRRPETDLTNYNAVSYAVIILILMFSSFFSIFIRLTRFYKTEFFLKFIIICIGYFSIVLTQTRTAFLITPFLILIALLLFFRKEYKKILLGFFIFLCVLSAFIYTVPTLNQRVHRAYTEFVTCQHNKKAVSSICVRFQLQRVAFDIWTKNPVLGMGNRDIFKEKLETYYVPKKIVSPFVGKYFAEPHHDILQFASSYGIFSVIGLLLVYFSPAVIFAKRLLSKHSSFEIRSCAAMGLTLCISFFIAGFFELMFRQMRTVGFYSAMLALFLVLSSKEEQKTIPFVDMEKSGFRKSYISLICKILT